MRKLIMKMSMSVDAFVSGPKGENDWIFKSSDEKSLAWVVGLCREAGLHVMGRKTFPEMASYWPTATGPIAEAMNDIPKAVFTRKGFAGVDLPGAEQSAAVASWTKARIFDGDLAEQIRALKAEPGNPILAQGGAGFMRSLMATGLIDVYHFVTHPVLLGSGLPVFNDLAKPLDLKLVDVKAFPKGIVVHTYHPG